MASVQSYICNSRGVCWRCGQIGHTRFNCVKEKVIFCSHCGLKGVMSRNCKCERNSLNSYDNKLNNITDTVKDVRPRLRVRIGKTEYMALINTGASLSYIGPTIVKWCKRRNIRRRWSADVSIIVADGREMNLQESFFIPLEVNNQLLTYEFRHISGLPFEVVLGVDFLKKKKITLSFDNTITLSVSNNSEENFNIS